MAVVLKPRGEECILWSHLSEILAAIFICNWLYATLHGKKNSYFQIVTIFFFFLQKNRQIFLGQNRIFPPYSWATGPERVTDSATDV